MISCSDPRSKEMRLGVLSDRIYRTIHYVPMLSSISVFGREQEELPKNVTGVESTLILVLDENNLED